MLKEKDTKAVEPEKEDCLTRRKLLVGAGALAVGAVTSAGVLGVNPATALSKEDVKIVVNGKTLTGLPANIVKGVTMAPVRPVAESLGASVAWDKSSKSVIITGTAGAMAMPEWPWPYKKLDPNVVRKIGYDYYFKGGCCYGAAAALLLPLRDTVGFPYTTIPIDMFRYGAGGGASWGTLCGALNGAGAVINMVTKDFAKVFGELMGWYTEFPFPSKDHEAYCKFKDQKQVVVKSPLCHVSVTLWGKAAGAKVNSAEKKDRCGKVTGDTAAKAVELLNALFDGNFLAKFKPSEEYAHCMGCHEGANSLLDDQQGKMNCTSCHTGHKN